MKRFIPALLFGLMFASCSPDIPVEPNSPISTPSAVENLENTQNGIESSLSENEKIKEKIERQQEIINNQKNEIDQAITRAKIIEKKAKENEKISSEEAFQLVNQLNKVRDRNMFLEIEVDKINKINKNQNEILIKTKKDAQETLKKLIAKENEAKELRSQNDYLSKNLKNTNNEILKLTKNLASAKVYKNWVIGLAIAFALYFIITVVIKIYKPF